MTDEQELYDTVGVSEDELINPGDLTVERGPDGELLPKTTEVPGTNSKIVHLPMARGDANKYLPDNYNFAQMSAASKAKVLNLFYAAPRLDEAIGEDHDDRLYGRELTELSEDELEEIDPEDKITAENISESFLAFGDADILIEAILEGSGLELMKERGEEMMDEGNLDPETVEAIMDSMNDSQMDNGKQR